MSLPVSQISLNCVIPAKHGNYRQTFEKIDFPSRESFDLRITNVTCKVDTTGLYNVGVTSVVRAYFSSGSHTDYTFEPGHYSLEAISEITEYKIQFENNCAKVVNCERVDFSQGECIRRICNYGENIVYADGKVNEVPADLSGGLNVLKFYSSLNQRITEKSSMFDVMIFQEMGLNNTVTYDFVSIPVVNAVTLDHIDWCVCDKYDRVIETIGAPVYINLVISVIPIN